MKSGKGEALRIFSIPTGGKKDKGDGKADRKAPKRKMKSKR